MNVIDQIEMEFSTLLVCPAHGGSGRWGITTPDRIGVPERVDHALAGGNSRELHGGRPQCCLCLQQRIIAQASQHDGPHFVPEPVKPPKAIEHAVVPEKLVGSRGQLGPEWTKLQVRLGTMIVEVAAYNAILQHAPEHDPVAARRELEPAGNDRSE